jgi:hypothetical protein
MQSSQIHMPGSCISQFSSNKKEDRELHSDERKNQINISQLIWDDKPQSTGAVFNQPRVRKSNLPDILSFREQVQIV